MINVKAKYWSKIAIFATVKKPCQNIAITDGMEKPEWYGYPVVKIC